MTVYDDELAAAARTPQAILTLGVRRCCNWYTENAVNECQANTDMGHITIWTRSGGGLTVSDDTHEAPDGTTTADTVLFAGVGDYIQNATCSTTAASKGWTGSFWIRTTAGAGTITIKLLSAAAVVETASSQENITTTWTKFWINKLFTGAAGGGALLRVERAAGDVAECVVWGMNLYRNPNDEDAVIKLPTLLNPDGTILNIHTCEASDAGDGSRCFYSFPTCQDPAHFNAGNRWESETDLQGIKEYKFCHKDAPLPLGGENIWPLLESVQYAKQEIDPERAVTIHERITFSFADDSGPGLWNVDKQDDGALVNTQTGVGTFWRRFLAIYKNYANPDCHVTFKVGFVASGMTEALYEQRFKGLMRNITIDGRDRIEMETTDRLKLAKDVEGPAEISEDNLINGSLTAVATTVTVDDAGEFTPPAANLTDYIVTAVLDPDGDGNGPEKVNITAIDLDNNQLTVQRGRWGTSAVTHVDNTKITEVMEFGTEHSTPSSTALGKNPIDIVIEILYRAGLTSDDIDTTTLESERDTWVYSDITSDVGTGTLFRRTVDESTKLEDLLTEIREVLMLYLWTGEDQQVTGKVFAPAMPGTTLTQLNDDDNFLADSIELDDNDESRITRPVIAWDRTADGDDDQLKDYQKIYSRVGTDEESRAFYGGIRTKVILSRWIQSTDTATVSKLAHHLLTRFRQGARKLSFALELKDDAVKCGDFVKVTTAKMQDAHGNSLTDRVFQILSKERAGPGRLEYESMDTGLLKKYGVIAPAGQADWGAATDAEKEYAYIGDAINNRLDSGADEGFYIW